MTQETTQKTIDAKTAGLLRASSRANGSSQPVREWYQLFPQSFYRFAWSEQSAAGNVFALRLMAEDINCCLYLCDTTLLDTPSAIILARRLATVMQDLDIRLARAAVEWVAGTGDYGSVRRCLLILDSLEPGNRINGSLVQLLGTNDSAIKSKVFELLIRTSFNEGNIRTWLKDPDPRIRANLLEALAKNHPHPEWVSQILIDHLSDPNGRTAANAAVALFRTGHEAEAVAQLDAMAFSQDAAKRCSVAWALGQLPEGNVEKTLKALRTDSDSRVRWNALKSLSRVHKNAPKTPAAPIAVPEIVPEESEIEIPELPSTPQPFVFNTRTFGRLI